MVFVHVPKTAGTSIEVALGHHGHDGTVTWGGQDHRTVRQLTWHHRPTRAVRSVNDTAEVLRAIRARVASTAPATRVTPDQFAAYLTFAVVRNPWDRAWSWYRNVMADPHQQARLRVGPGLTFPAFLRAQLGRDCLRPQTYWLHDFRGRVGVDLVCRFEELDRDWPRVCEAAGLGTVALPRVNAGVTSAAYPYAYDRPTRELVADVCRAEIQLFGYRFGDAAVTR